MTNITKFREDLQSWNNISSNFSSIKLDINSNDILEWHVTISKYANDNEYKFHFMIFWHNGWHKIQPKICLLFGQRCMVNSSHLVDSWLLLDKNITIFSISSVLIGLNNIVREINVNNIDYYEFNSHSCLYCRYGNSKNEKINKIKKDNMTVSNDSNNDLSISNLSMISLTVSNYTDNTVDTQSVSSIQSSKFNKEVNINQNSKIAIDNDASEISTKSIVVSISNDKKIKKCEDELISNTKINMSGKRISKPKQDTKIEENEETLKSNKKMEPKTKCIKASSNNDKIDTSQPVVISKSKINKSEKIIKNPKINPKVNKKTGKNDKKIYKEAVRYLEVDENGFLVWKWSEGRRPNQKISLNSSSKSFRWNNKKN